MKISKTEWYVMRIGFAMGLAICFGLIIGVILCMLNVGHWIDPVGFQDDNFIGYGLILLSTILGWKFSAHLTKIVNEFTHPSQEIIYEHKKL